MKFELQLVITERCNLACKYCYMHKKSRDMTPEIFDRILYNMSRVLKLHNKTFYSVVFFGGEPTLNWDLITHAIPKIEADPLSGTSKVIITNGLLLDDEKINFVKQDESRRFSFSYDGIWQETNRPSITGKSNQHIYDKLINSVYQDFSGGFKTMLSPDNLDTLIENFYYCIDHNITFVDFTLVRDDIWNETDIEKYEYYFHNLVTEYIKVLKQGKPIILSLIFLYLAYITNHALHGKPNNGCYAGHAGMAFMPNGDGYPCARFGTNDILKLYDYETDTFIEQNFLKLTNRLVNVNTYPRCKKCIANNICKAGCLYSQCKTDGVEYWGEPIESICKLTKITFKEVCRFLDEIKNDPIFSTFVFPMLNNIKN